MRVVILGALARFARRRADAARARAQRISLFFSYALAVQTLETRTRWARERPPAPRDAALEMSRAAQLVAEERRRASEWDELAAAIEAL